MSANTQETNMSDKDLMENVLQLEKGVCDLFLHGTIESSSEDVHKAFCMALNSSLATQDTIYNRMAEKGWYPTEQAEQSCKNVAAVLEAGGSSMEKVVKTTCFLADMGDFATFNEVYARYFTEKPARSCVAVKTLPKNVLCEVEVIAEVGTDR